MTAGRPTKFNAKRANLIIEAVRKGNFITTAAKAAGVHQTTIDSWRRKGKEAKSGKLHKFYLALEEAEALGEMDAVEDWRELRKKSPEAINQRQSKNSCADDTNIGTHPKSMRLKKKSATLRI